MKKYNPIQLELYKGRFSAIAEEMGEVLRRAAYSPNIKERLDFSCAFFNTTGEIIAQAAHIPVHLGAMPISVKTVMEQLTFEIGDVVILNDPYSGGSHLPDITIISPVFDDAELFGFVATRAHHADVGGMSPGSMPNSREIFQEGIIIPPVKLIEQGEINQSIMRLILANVRTPNERTGDLHAQIAANQRGVERLIATIKRYGKTEVTYYMEGLLEYSEHTTRSLLADFPDGKYTFHDFMDNDGVDPEPIKIAVTITIEGDEAIVDFNGSSPQVKGSVNAVYAVTLSAVYYVFRALIGLDIPSNSGCVAPITVIAPEGTIVNAQSPAAVVGGNVETSQRITDVLLGALAQACPDKIPAASQGTMNNVTIGGWNPEYQQPFTYYETIGGGMGASANQSGTSAIHSHMTNTRNTPIEALEYAYPFRMQRYAIRHGSGGKGKKRGGDGIIREMELLTESTVTLLTERRRFSPYGLNDGKVGQVGYNILIRNGERIELPAKTSLIFHAGDRLLIETPGGGGYGTTKLL